MAKLNRDGTFFAADGKHTGQEPNWHDWESLSNVEFGIKVVSQRLEPPVSLSLNPFSAPVFSLDKTKE